MFDQNLILRISFPIIHGKAIDTDHAESLYSAISSHSPFLHQNERLAISTVMGGVAVGNRLILNRRSKFFLLCPSNMFYYALSLSGKELKLRNDKVRLGIPRLETIFPSTKLVSRMVVIRNTIDPDKMLVNIIQKLRDWFGEQADLIEVSVGRRRILRIHSRKIAGFEVTLNGLTPEQSVFIQSHPIAGRSRYGCSIFVPAKE